MEDASLMVLAKNNQKFCAENGIDHGKFIGMQQNTAGVSYTLLPWLPLLLCSVKYEQEERVEHQQTADLSGEHKNFCLKKVVLCCYDCFGYITVIYPQHSTVNNGEF